MASIHFKHMYLGLINFVFFHVIMQSGHYRFS